MKEKGRVFARTQEECNRCVADGVFCYRFGVEVALEDAA